MVKDLGYSAGSVEGREPGLCQGTPGLLFKVTYGVRSSAQRRKLNWSHWQNHSQVPLPRFTRQLWRQVKVTARLATNSAQREWMEKPLWELRGPRSKKATGFSRTEEQRLA